MIVSLRFARNAEFRMQDAELWYACGIYFYRALRAHIHFAFCILHFAFLCASTTVNNHLLPPLLHQQLIQRAAVKHDGKAEVKPQHTQRHSVYTAVNIGVIRKILHIVRK